MDWIPRALRWILLIGVLLLGSCLPPRATPIPDSVSTASPSPSATVLWFPPTATPKRDTPLPPTATPNRRPGVRRLLAEDDFSSADAWDTAESDNASAIVSRNRITLAIQPGIYLVSMNRKLTLSDFYAEITARVSLCKDNDSYGILFRANGGAYYRYALSCNGDARLDRISNGRRIPLQPPIPSADAPPGSPGETRIGVWAVGPEMRFFLNGRYQFTVVDPTLSEGAIGVFAKSGGDTAVTIAFSDLQIRSVSYVSPTPSPTPTRTPVPTSTMKP